MVESYLEVGSYKDGGWDGNGMLSWLRLKFVGFCSRLIRRGTFDDPENECCDLSVILFSRCVFSRLILARYHGLNFSRFHVQRKKMTAITANVKPVPNMTMRAIHRRNGNMLCRM